MTEKKDWCDGKKKDQIEKEMWLQILAYDFKTLRELFFDSLTLDEKKAWVNSWHDNDE